ncbi:MAG: tetratricopeptide repeat protein [Chloroflexota bacterium]
MAYTARELADAFIKAGELADALDAINKHMATSPEDAEMRRLRVQVYLRVGEPEHLKAALTDLAQVEMSSADYYTQSVIYEWLGQLNAAHDAAVNAHAQDPQLKSRSLERLLYMKRKTGRLDEALTMALENDWVQWAADAAADLNDDAKAIEYYDRALERVEKLFDMTSDNIAANIRARVLVKRGAAYQRQGQHTEAEADYSTALEAIPDDWGIMFNRGLVLAHLGRVDEAKTLVKQAVDAAPESQRSMLLSELATDETYADLRP